MFYDFATEDCVQAQLLSERTRYTLIPLKLVTDADMVELGNFQLTRLQSIQRIFMRADYVSVNDLQDYT